MTAVNWQFNANQFEPNQGLGIHPPAQKIPFQISATSIKETKDKEGNYLEIEFSSPLGIVIHRYNINNKSAKATEIAYGQLSSLCRAIQVYNIDGNNECAALRGGRGLMDVGYQKGEDPTDNPDAKGYTELKRVYDLAGNDPSRPGQANVAAQNTAQVQPSAAPMTQQVGGGWGNGQPQQQPAQQASNPSWNGAAGQAPVQQAQQGQAWQPGNQPAGGGTPPWGART